MEDQGPVGAPHIAEHNAALAVEDVLVAHIKVHGGKVLRDVAVCIILRRFLQGRPGVLPGLFAEQAMLNLALPRREYAQGKCGAVTLWKAGGLVQQEVEFPCQEHPR